MGRKKGFTLSDDHKRKIGEGVSSAKERKAEIDSYCLQVEESLPLEEALVNAVEKYQYCRWRDHKAPPETQFLVEATSYQNRYYASEEEVKGIQNTIPAARRLLALVNAQYIIIAVTVPSEKEGYIEDPEPVVVVKEDKEGERYRVGMWYREKWW